jgi:Zn-dependent protease
MPKKRGSGTLRLGRIFGIPVELHYTWFFIFLLLAWGLATGFFPAMYPDLSVLARWILGAASAVLLFVSVLLHELMHSVVAKAFKMDVHKITLFFFGGVASIPDKGMTPKKEFWMAIAGPLFSLGLGFLFFAVFKFSTIVYLTAVSRYLYFINFILAGFNMVPGFPLDGGRVFRSILWAIYKDITKATRIAAYGGKIFAVILIVMGFLNLIGIVIFIFGGIWFIILGFFLYMIAGASYQQIILRELLGKVHVHQIMTRSLEAVPPDINAKQLFADYFLARRRTSFLVARNKKFVGIVTVAGLKQVPKEQWQKTPVTKIMIKGIRAAHPEESAFTALIKMLEQDLDILPVIKDGSLVGMLDRQTLAGVVRVKTELS